MSNTIIQIKKSIVPGNVPISLESGELAINTADGILFYKNPNNVIKSISTGSTSNSFSTINVNSTLLIATTSNDILSISGNNGVIVTGDYNNDSIIIQNIDGSTSQKGIIQLYDGLDSTSTTLAATANALNYTYNLANLAYNSSGSGPTSTNLSYQEFTASTNQTEFFITNGYVVGKIKVFVNGVLLNSSDYTATNGTSIILSSPASLNDDVSIQKWYSDTSIANSYNLLYGNIDSNNIITTTNSANQVLDLFSTALYRSVKYQVQVTSSTDYQISELLLIHDGTNSYITEYGLLTTNAILMNYDTDISGGSVRLLISPTNNDNTIKFTKTSIVV